MEKEEIQFVDRYSATGTPYPDENSCDWCEGMGVSPMHKNKLNSAAVEAKNGRLIIIGQREENGTPMQEDEYVFVRCPECFGTKKKNPTQEQILERLKKEFNF